jgi:hypothetical protein
MSGTYLAFLLLVMCAAGVFAVTLAGVSWRTHH